MQNPSKVHQVQEPRRSWASTDRPRRWPLHTVMVTGARNWTCTESIRAALAWVWHPGTILIHGDCPTGADALAAACWTHWRGKTVAHPANWDRWGKAAGPLRNKQMVDEAPDMALAFLLPRSKGTAGTVATLVGAGVPTYLIDHRNP